MSLNYLKSKLATLEIQMGFLKKQIEELQTSEDINYKSLIELKGMWKSSNLTTDGKIYEVLEIDGGITGS